ncbi:MAG: 3-hydroxyacyl-CoA dehydrogenase [Gammaproteobacteria bacterium]|nr:3-hydroxyacyl-CoA dehydrogenase [Gammaproteobacteria bacterium]
MTGRLAGKTAWITGAGRGIGRSIALAMAAEGANLGLSSRTSAELETVADEARAAGGQALAVVADAMSLASTLAAAEAIAAGFGAIDILVNNAGGGVPPRSDPDLSDAARDDFAFMDNVDLNLFSAYRASQAVLPGMLERKDGRIINIGSGYAKRSGGGLAYSAAKHGLIGLTRSMAANVATRGVTINCLCPGWTNTQLVDLDRMAAAARTDVPTVRATIEAENLQKRILEPEELGPMAVLLAAPESYGITGQVISVDGGYGV